MPVRQTSGSSDKDLWQNGEHEICETKMTYNITGLKILQSDPAASMVGPHHQQGCTRRRRLGQQARNACTGTRGQCTLALLQAS